MKLKLVSYWRDAWKFWSVKLAALGTLLVTFATLAPEAALQAWFALPEELKQVIPPAYVQGFGVVLMALSIVAKFIRQQKLEAELVAKGTMENSQPPPPPQYVEHDTGKPLGVIAALIVGLIAFAPSAAEAAVEVQYVYEVVIKRSGTAQTPTYRSIDKAAAELACRNAIAQKSAAETSNVVYTCTPAELLGVVTYTPTSTNLPAPQNFIVVPNSTNPTTQASMSWGGVAGALAYDIHRCIGANCTNFSRLSCYQYTSRVAGSLTPGQTYRFRIRASKNKPCSTDIAGNLGAWTPIVSITMQTVAQEPPPPDPVSYIATLDWTYTPSEGTPTAEGFRIVYGKDKDGAGNFIFDKVIDVPGFATQKTYVVDGLTTENNQPTTWHFAVKTYGGGNESLMSVVRTKVIG